MLLIWGKLVLLFMICRDVSASEMQQIPFSNFCEYNINPGMIPGLGKASSGSFFLGDARAEENSYEPGLNCSVSLSTENGYHLLVVFSVISLRNSTLDSLIVVYDDGKRHTSIAGQQKCPNENCSNFMFESGDSYHNMTFDFRSANVTVPAGYSGFRAVYTAFDKVSGSSKFRSCRGKNQFLCLNGHCIASELYCDGHNNCGDRSDEVNCSVPMLNTIWGILLIVGAVISVLVFLPLFCFLAKYGTYAAVKVTTLSSRATPLYSAVNDDETTHLLSSSGAPSGYLGSVSYEQQYTTTHGSVSKIAESEPSVSTRSQRHSFRNNTEARGSAS